MEMQQLQEVMDCLAGDPTKFYYFKDRYALLMLSYMIGSGMRMSELKKSRYAKFINKPLVKDVLKSAGKPVLTRDMLFSLWPHEYHCYLLTLGTWGGKKNGARFYKQTSRPGWNLVLQLNFSAKHIRAYERLIQPQRFHPFENYAHPVRETEGVHTLAWARIDLDLASGEALIEEIQNDWIRLALNSRKYIGQYETASSGGYVPYYIKGLGCDAQSLTNYIDDELKPHVAIWEEAMLMATVWFLKEEVGISDIFYHTFETGCQLKRIDGTRPPRSLYTHLPQKFCFTETERVPEILLQKSNRRTTRLVKGKGRKFYLLTV